MGASDAVMIFPNNTDTAGNYSATEFSNNTTTVSGAENDTVTAILTTAGPESQSLQSYEDRVLVAVLWLLVALINIVGNTMVILAVVFSEKLWTSTNVFVISLSVSDLLTGLALPMSVVGLLSPGDTWPLSTEAPCYIAGMLLYISSAASLFNLACIALNRLILIKRPRTLYRSLYTKRNLAINVAVLWFVAVATMVLPPLFGIGGFGYDEQHHTCSDLDTHPKAKTFERIQTFLSYPIPFLIIITCYILIFVHVRRHFQAQRTMRCDPAPSSSNGSSSFAVSDNTSVLKTAHQDRLYRQQLEITKNLFVAVCAFFVCITPYSVALFIPNTDRYLLYLGVVFTSNSCVNPIIYAAKHPQFKKVMRRMIKCQYLQIEEPSDALKALVTCQSKV